MPLARARALVAASCVVLYAVAAYRLGEIYPVSRFDMFSSGRTSSQRVAVRVDGDTLAEVASWSGWACGDDVKLPFETAPPCTTEGHPETETKVLSSIRAASPADGAGVPLAVIRRTYRVVDPEAGVSGIQIRECLLLRCTAEAGAHGD